MSRARRGRGEGSIYQRKDGRWVAVLSSGIEQTGKRKRYMAYADKKDDALKKLDLLRRKHGIRGQHDPPLRDFLNAWLHDIESGLSGATYDSYSRLIDVISRDLGETRLSALRMEQIQRWSTAERNVTRQKALRLLRQALNHAEATDLVFKNPAQHVKAPKVCKSERVVLSPEQVNSYLDACDGDRLEALVIVALFTTMREGELLALQWPDIDWDTKTVHVQRALKKDRGGKWIIGPPKTASSRRAIALPEFVVVALQAHRKRMMAEHHGSLLVFCSATGTTMNPANVRNRFHYPTLEKAKLPRITFHDLRHTAASLLAGLGVHPKVAQDRLGHSTVRLTLELYTHADLSQQRDAAQKLDDKFRR